MRNKQWLSCLFIVVVGVILLNNTLMAQERKPDSAHENRMKLIQEAEEQGLGLTDDQRLKFKELREAMKVKLEAIRIEMQSKYDALNNEKNSDDPDRAKGVALLKDIASLQEQSGLVLFEHIFDIKSLLSPEQYVQFRDMNQKNANQHKTWRRHSSSGK